MTDRAKEARRRYYRQWREKNREHLREYQRQYRKTHKAQIRAAEERRWEKIANEEKQKS